ncbi:MAG: hypothetical protein ACI8PZ_000092 [Myxococcota bacterium]|jgi:hypothetical protein
MRSDRLIAAWATGWIRTLGGSEAYLALLARVPTVQLADVHAAVGRRDLQVLPAVRGCIYVVPRAHAPLALALARDLSARRDARDRAKAGVADGELQAVGEAALALVADGPCTTSELRRGLPDGVVRSLGAVGKAIGVTSTLPPALRALEFAGRIARQPVGNSLDSERYAWHVADIHIDPRPVAERAADLARIFLRSFAPATSAELAAYSGLGKRVAKRAFDDIGAVEVGPHGHALSDQVDSLDTDPGAAVRLLPALDNLLVWHDGPSAFIDPRDQDRTIAVWGRQKGNTWGTVKHALTRVVVRGGRVCGAWDWDPTPAGWWAGRMRPASRLAPTRRPPPSPACSPSSGTGARTRWRPMTSCAPVVASVRAL